MTNILQYPAPSRESRATQGRSTSEEYAEIILLLTPEDEDYESMRDIIKGVGYAKS